MRAALALGRCIAPLDRFGIKLNRVWASEHAAIVRVLSQPTTTEIARRSARGQIRSLEEAADVAARPFLRWAGGKTRLLRRLLPHFPERFANYYEPFLGGGAVFFAIGDRAAKRHTLTDLNEELINTWLIARERPLELLDALRAYDGRNDEVAYYEVRNGPPVSDALSRAARFVYLNQTAWNGLWRVNQWGRFNVPWGARPFRGIDEAELLSVSAALRDAAIELADFRDVLARPQAGDFVYLDPPYLPVSDTSKFAGYTEKRFRAADLAELAALCEAMTARGVNWVLSNRDTDLVRDLFSHAKIIRITTRRSVAAQNRRDIQPANSPEAIVVGGA
jgi:DNA adenine methylase